MNCALVCRHMDACVDGELDPGTQVEFERHLSECASCQEQLSFERSFKAQVKAGLGDVTAPPALRERIRSAVSREDVDEGADRHAFIPVLPARYGVPLAAAATVLLALVGTTGWASMDDEAGPTRADAVMPVLEDVLRMQRSDAPPDVQGTPPRIVSYFRNKVDFAVHPPRFEGHQVRLEGARLSNVREHSAAALYYDAGGRRVTVVVFEPGEELLHGAVRVRMGNRDVYYQRARGYTVPMVRRNGVTYAITGDLDQQSLLRLAASAEVVP
jgi:mycothiol system anti-sigma-R factor